jgi:hypothetical protein
MRRDLALLLAPALILAGCQTITEELPTRPTPQLVTVPIPVVVVPVPNPNPAPAPAPNPAPNPNPAPAPAPTPKPDPNPEPPPNPAGGTVVKVGLKVYFVEDSNGVPIPGSEGATSALVGQRVHLDSTPKDASNKPTTPKGQPSWNYSNPGLVNVSGKNPYTPVLNVKGKGSMSIDVEVDGVRSNTISLTFK